MGVGCSLQLPVVAGTTLGAQSTTKGRPLTTVAEYKVRRTIANGAYGEVYHVVKEGENYAMKVIDMNRMSRNIGFGIRKNTALESVKNEIDVLNKIHHRNTIVLLESIHDPLAKKYFLVTEMLYAGGALGKQESVVIMSEADARVVFREVRAVFIPVLLPHKFAL